MSGDMVVDLKDDAFRERELWLRDFKIVSFVGDDGDDGDDGYTVKRVPLSGFFDEGILDKSGLTVDEFLSGGHIFPSDGDEWSTAVQQEIRPEGLSYSEISAIAPIFADRGEASVALTYEDWFKGEFTEGDAFVLEAPNGVDALSVAELVFEWLKENGRDYVIYSVGRYKPKASEVTSLKDSFKVFKLKGIRKVLLETFDSEVDALNFAQKEVRRDTHNRVQVESLKTTVVRATPNDSAKIFIGAKKINNRGDEIPETVDAHSILVFGDFKKSLERLL